MLGENQFIKAELRFAGNEEHKVILDELSLSGAINIIEYDGMVEAELPLSSLEIMKNNHILIDFPSQKRMVANENVELFSMPAESQNNWNSAEAEWISGFKMKVDRSHIDIHSNLLKEKAEKLVKDSDEETPVTSRKTVDNNLEMAAPSSGESKGETTIKAEDLYLISFKGLLSAEVRTQFIQNNIKLTAIQNENKEYGYKAFLTKEQYQYLASHNMTVSVIRYGMERKLSSNMVQQFSKQEIRSELQVVNKTFDIVLSDEKYMEKISQTILSEKATIIDSGLNMIRIKASPESDLLAALAGSPYVSMVALHEPPQLYCDVARKTLGLEFLSPAGVFLGEGEIVGVIDSGIDETHPDLKNRIKAALQFGEGLKHDMVGHGTHVAGIICGDGTASLGKITGMAPKAQVVSVGIVSNTYQVDLPVDIGRLLKIATDNGAKIINLSLGKKVSGDYQLGSFSVDKYVYENPEILVVVAAGNEGNAMHGQLAYKTVGAPATAKNVLTVGASSCRRTTPIINQTWGGMKPSNFPSPPHSGTQLISSEDHPSLGSSTGPTDFDSIKPEVLAPGNFILSAKAATTDIKANNPEYFDSNYTFKTGTSMATPLISGIAALVREYLAKEHNHKKPSSALIKAIIIGNSQKIENIREDNSLSKIGFPDFDQGFGLVDLSKMLNKKTIKLFFDDVFNIDPKALESRTAPGGPVKSTREYVVEVTDGAEDMSVTLTWIDPPARGVQNNLQLSVKSPSNKWDLGNMDHLYKKDELFDSISVYNLKPHDKYNNSEKVLIKNPSPGKYLIRITAQNTLSKQGYSVAVLGNILSFIER